MQKEKILFKERLVPKSMQDMKVWQLTRKQFIGSLLTAGIAAQLPFNKAFGNSRQAEDFLSDELKSILLSVQEILFPSNVNGPGATEINAYDYVIWVMSDPQKDPSEVTYFKNGIGWIEESATEIFSKKYIELTEKEKQELIGTISKETWGESWLAVLLTFIFEALLSNPQYGGNPDGIGWTWLKFTAGIPWPTPELLYPEIFQTVKENKA